jgi:hypothetical protein
MIDRYTQLRLEGFTHRYCVRFLGLSDNEADHAAWMMERKRNV